MVKPYANRPDKYNYPPEIGSEYLTPAVQRAPVHQTYSPRNSQLKAHY